MKQREVRDADGVQWVCVQAMGGIEGRAGAEAAARIETDDGRVPVVCTPSGGAETARVEMPRGWEESASDDDLLRAIAAARA